LTKKKAASKNTEGGGIVGGERHLSPKDGRMRRRERESGTITLYAVSPHAITMLLGGIK